MPHVPPSWAQKVGGPYQQSSEMHGVQSADECQLHIETATTPELFQGIDLAPSASFEEVAYLFLNGHLPTASEFTICRIAREHG